MHIFCRCGFLPRAWRVSESVRMIGSVPVRPRPHAPTYCHALGFRWGWDPRPCQAERWTDVEGMPLCKRHWRVAVCTLPHDRRSIEQRWKDRTAIYEKMPLWTTDGGRQAAGFKYSGGDCVWRAIAIAEARPYAEVAEALFSLGASKRRKGCANYIYDNYLVRRGWRKVKAPRGTYLRKGHLPNGRLLVLVSGHMLAVIDGTIHDTYDSSGRGTRRVVAYYTKEAA